jgi:bifunctional DNA-binding transcriptional regulator/antitoxin component of YhaV-PrlF toxin-antitoxin module
MEEFMRVTQKGQVTIPEEIRQKYGFLPYTSVEFVEKNGKVYLQIGNKKQSSRGNAIVSHLRRTATVRMTTDEILKMTRGEK